MPSQPRQFAKVQCTIWDDPDFVALDPDARDTYFMLISQVDMHACGLLPLTLRRWSQYVSRGDRRALADRLKALVRARFVLIDQDTEELLVRTFVKWDDGWKHSLRLKAILSSAAGIRSERLREACTVELVKLGINVHGVPRNASPMPPETLFDPTLTPSEDATLEGSETDRNGIPEPLESQRLPSYVTQPSTETGDGKQKLERGDAPTPTPTPDPEPDPWCRDHPGGTDDPCGGCGSAKRRRAEWETRERRRRAEATSRAAREQAAARQAAIDDCDLCGHDGYRLLAGDTTGGLCDHQQRDTGTRLAAAKATAGLTREPAGATP